MRLKVSLYEDLGVVFMDGVVFCYLVNYICLWLVVSIYVLLLVVFKFSMVKCRRNVENFLEVCWKLGVLEEKLCLFYYIFEEKGLVKVGIII